MDKRAGLSGARPGIDQERAAAPGRGLKLAAIQRVAWAGAAAGGGAAERRQEQGTDGLIHDKARRDADVLGDVRAACGRVLSSSSRSQSAGHRNSPAKISA